MSIETLHLISGSLVIMMIFAVILIQKAVKC
jgi:hypothetical protein